MVTAEHPTQSGAPLSAEPKHLKAGFISASPAHPVASPQGAAPSSPEARYLGGLHELLPVAVPDGGVLQLTHGAQGRDRVLHGVVQPHEGIPALHLLVQGPHSLGELLAVYVHLLDVDVLPLGGLPVTDAGVDLRWKLSLSPLLGTLQEGTCATFLPLLSGSKIQ